MEFGKIRPLKLAELWEKEAVNFTPWLANHLDLLADKIGMELQFVEREVAAGDFSVDILARDAGNENIVIIENQYNASDHKHLGQILTYAANTLGVRVVVWIAESFRSEHKAAIDLLNQAFKDQLQFFAIETKIFKIDDSLPAFDLTVVCQPTGIDSQNGKITMRNELYRRFFQNVIDELRTQHNFTDVKTSKPRYWYNFPSESPNVYTYGISFANKNRVRAEIYIETRDTEKNKRIFSQIEQKKEEIEDVFGEALSWELLPERRTCRIAAYREGSIDDSEVLSEIKDWAISQLLKFKQIIPQYMVAAVEAAEKTVSESL